MEPLALATTPVTLHDVARRAQVSIATVSRALSGHAVSAESLAKVQEAAVQLGYVANAGARLLRSDKTMTVGLLFRRLSQPLGLQLVDALGGVLDDAGYTLFVATARNDEATYDALMRRFLERRVDALICVHACGDGQSLRAYAMAQAPVLTVLDRSSAFVEAPHIYPSFVEPARDAIGHLARLGHRRIGLVRDNLPADLLGQLKLSGLEVVELDCPASAPDLSAAVRTWTAPGGITAVFAAHDVAQAVILELACQGLSAPTDLSVVAIAQNLRSLALERAPLSAIVTDGRKMGAAVGQAVLRLLAGETLEPLQGVVDATFKVGGTIGPAPKR